MSDIGMARTSEPIAQPVQQAPPAPSTHSSVGEKFLPGEVYRFFNVNPIGPDKTANKYLGEIYKWASKDAHSLGDTLTKLRDIERKVGQPALDEHRYTRVYNYVRMSSFMDSMKEDKRRFKENASRKYREQQKQIEVKLAEIKKKEKREMSEIDKESKFHIKELNKMQKVYEG